MNNPMTVDREGAPVRDGYNGHVDTIDPVLSGWIAKTAQTAPVHFSLQIDRSHRVSVIADRPRYDVAASGLAGPNCGFSIELPTRFCDGGEHELAVLLADGRNLDLPGLPPSVALGLVLPQVVPANAVGLDAVLELLRRNDVEAGYDPEQVGLHNAAAFNLVAVPEDGFVYYARVGSRLVGYARLDRGAGGAAGIGVVALTVLAAYRRKGLGEALMRVLLHAARAADGIGEVWLSVRPENSPAIGLYEKLGFRPEAAHPLGGRALPGEIAMLWRPGP